MLTINPFSVLSESVPSLAMQFFLITMIGLVVLGTLIDIIHSIITHDDDILICKEKSNIIKFMNKENKIIYENIENFGIQICNYIFDHLKPIVENCLLNTLENDNENYKENNRVQNIMLLKDSKFSINAITKILNRLN